MALAGCSCQTLECLQDLVFDTIGRIPARLAKQLKPNLK